MAYEPPRKLRLLKAPPFLRAPICGPRLYYYMYVFGRHLRSKTTANRDPRVIFHCQLSGAELVVKKILIPNYS